MITDDFSMARCFADSILANNFEFNGVDLRDRSLLWWHFGYNNISGDQPCPINTHLLDFGVLSLKLRL